jgi:hypothetical protein
MPSVRRVFVFEPRLSDNGGYAIPTGHDLEGDDLDLDVSYTETYGRGGQIATHSRVTTNQTALHGLRGGEDGACWHCCSRLPLHCGF